MTQKIIHYVSHRGRKKKIKKKPSTFCFRDHLCTAMQIICKWVAKLLHLILNLYVLCCWSPFTSAPIIISRGKKRKKKQMSDI